MLPHLPAHLSYPKTPAFPIIDTPSLAGTSSSSGSNSGGSSIASMVSGLTSVGRVTGHWGGGGTPSNRTRQTFQVNLTQIRPYIA